MGAQFLQAEGTPQAQQNLASAHLRFARSQAQWQFIEPFKVDPPLFNWGGLDAVINTQVQHGFTPVINVLRNPSWAATTTCGPVDLVPLSRFGDFIAAMVERYDGDGLDDAPGSPRVSYWEIGNEQDYDVESPGGNLGEGNDVGSCFGGNEADEYGEMLREAYLRAKAADSTAQIMFGSVAFDRLYEPPGNPRCPSGTTCPFDPNLTSNALEHLYDTYGDGAGSGWPYFDLVGIHVFNDFRNFWDGAARPIDQELIGKLSTFKQEQLLVAGKFDLRDSRIAVTELSLPSLPFDAFTDRNETLQAVYPGQAYIRALAAGVEMAIWFSGEDHRYEESGCGNRYAWLAFGLLRSQEVYDRIQANCSPIPDWLADYQVTTPHEAKPALDGARVASEQLACATYDRQLNFLEIGGDIRIEAHRFQEVDGAYVVGVFTDTGERIGRIGTSPVVTSMTFSAFNLPDWTGTLLVTDHLGNQQTFTGSSVTVLLSQAPVYVRAVP
jgi:hypothetical protein